MKYIYSLVMLLILAVSTMEVWAESPHHDHPAPAYDAPDITYITEVTEVYNVTETVYATEEQVAQALETASPSVAYSPDHCNGVAIAQAGANNHMYHGTDKPQISIGLGECGGEFATSLMGGLRLNNKLMLTGSWAMDEDVNAFGTGITFIFK